MNCKAEASQGPRVARRCDPVVMNCTNAAQQGNQGTKMTNPIKQATLPDRASAAAHACLLHTASGVHALDIGLADSFLRRFRGLMLAPALAPQRGWLITRCPSVHSAFMLHAIDVIYLDHAGQVLKCVPRLKPWRASFSSAGKDAQGRPHVRASHALELAAGSIERLAIGTGDRLEHPHWAGAERGQRGQDAAPAGQDRRRQGGSAKIEFTVVGPVITVLGLAILQYGMFFAKNQINHASFIAARAGSTGHAGLSVVQTAYASALVPLYGGGQTTAELAASRQAQAFD
jgi:uncharacterized membrane protein (UPF0127 family)